MPEAYDTPDDDPRAESDTDTPNRVTDGPAIDIQMGDVSVYVRGGPDDTIDDIRAHYDEILPRVITEYVEHRDSGTFY